MLSAVFMEKMLFFSLRASRAKAVEAWSHAALPLLLGTACLGAGCDIGALEFFAVSPSQQPNPPKNLRATTVK